MLKPIRGTQNFIKGFAVPLFFFCGSVLAAAIPADEIDALSAAGAPTLALKFLQQSEPNSESDPAAWTQWLQQKIAIYQQQQQWDRVIHDLEDVSTRNLPAEFKQWVWTQIAQAYLMTDRGEEARLLLTQVIWAGSELPSQTVQTWRRMVVESYLSEDRMGDAYTAMLRYRQDYPEDDAADWKIVQARVLLANERASETLPLLTAMNDVRAEVIAALAKNQLGETLDSSSLESLSLKLGNPLLSFDLRQQLLNVLLAQVNKLPVGAQQIQLLEQIVISAGDVEGIEGSAASDQLWTAYQDYGNQLANQLQLLVGDFEPWFSAIDRMEQTSPVQARALLEVIANGEDKSSAQKAHLKFSHLLATQERDKALLKPLYLGSSRTMEVGALPAPVLYLLIDQALDGGDHATAAKLMNLMQGPGLAQSVDWRLRRARSQILAGVAPVGADIAKDILRSGQTLERAQFEYLIRIDFDLQRTGQLDPAYQLFSLMLNEAPDLNLRREIVLSMADIRFAEKKYDEAARLYFDAANVINSDSQDVWPQVARHQAAQALVKAGYIDDARQVYGKLLQDVNDPERRAVLQRELQQLQLLARHK